jgi:hypothetical protein
MSATLAKQFEDYAVRRLELARSAKTTAGRARFMQMAREYQSAAALIRECADLSAGYHKDWHPLPPPYDFDGWQKCAFGAGGSQ